MLGVPELLMMLVFFVVGIFGTIFWIWMLIECATKEPSEGNERLVWVIIVTFTHIIGAAIYFFVRRPKRKAELGE